MGFLRRCRCRVELVDEQETIIGKWTMIHDPEHINKILQRLFGWDYMRRSGYLRAQALIRYDLAQKRAAAVRKLIQQKSDDGWSFLEKLK